MHDYDRCSIDHCRKYHNIPQCSLFVTPKFCIRIVFSFSWGHFNPQEKLKTMLMQNFGLANKQHYNTLFDGLAYSTCGYFASCVVFFRAPQGRNVRSYYMLNHRIRGLLFHYKKKKLCGNWLLFFGKSIQRHPDSVCEPGVTLTSSKMFARIICQTIE